MEQKPVQHLRCAVPEWKPNWRGLAMQYIRSASLIASLIASTYPAYADTESMSRPAYLSERSTLVDFSYEEVMLFGISEDVVVELVQEAVEEPLGGPDTLRRQLSSVSEVFFSFKRGGERGCFSIFGSIRSARLYFEFGALVDLQYLNDLRPIFSARAQVDCSTRHEEDGNVVYSLISFDDRRENQPVRLLYVDKKTGMAHRVEREN
jgi:hypothetical protein